MSYVVQQGDTIAQVTKHLDMSWQRLSSLNPHAVGRSSRNGNYFLREGAVLKTDASAQPQKQEMAPVPAASFQTIMKEKVEPVSPFAGESARDADRSGEPAGPEGGAILKADASAQPEKQEMAPGPAPPPALEPVSVADEPKGWITHTVKRGDTLWALALKRYHVNLNDLIRDNNITDPKALQPGQELRVRVHDYPEEDQKVVASWYGKPYHGRPMANGETYNMHAATIAHPTLPLGVRVELENPDTGVRVQAKITDRGPFVEGREVDISYGLAKKLSFVEKGVGKLLMRILGGGGEPAETADRASPVQGVARPGT